MKTILVIPHGNADCERIFSIVRINHTDFNPILSCDTLSSLFVAKIFMTESGITCYLQVYSQQLLAEAKSATYLALQGISSTANNTASGENALSDLDSHE